MWSNGEKLPQFLFVWERLYLCYIFKGKFCLVGSFFLSVLWIYHPSLSCSERFLLRNPLIVLCGFSYMICRDTFLCCSENFLSLWFLTVIMCFGLVFFGMILVEGFWLSWIQMFISRLSFGKFSPTIFKNKLFTLFFILLWDLCNVYIRSFAVIA